MIHHGRAVSLDATKEHMWVDGQFVIFSSWKIWLQGEISRKSPSHQPIDRALKAHLSGRATNYTGRHSQVTQGYFPVISHPLFSHGLAKELSMGAWGLLLWRGTILASLLCISSPWETHTCPWLHRIASTGPLQAPEPSSRVPSKESEMAIPGTSPCQVQFIQLITVCGSLLRLPSSRVHGTFVPQTGPRHNKCSIHHYFKKDREKSQVINWTNEYMGMVFLTIDFFQEIHKRSSFLQRDSKAYCD